MRHGLSEANTQGVFAGLMDTPLVPEGVEQARDAGVRLRALGVVPDAIVTSCLQRAMDTAAIIAGEIGFEPSGIMRSATFNERSFGPMEGVSVQAFLDRHSWSDLDAVEGMETLEAMQIRARRALGEVIALERETVVIVSHGAFGRGAKILSRISSADFSDTVVGTTTSVVSSVSANLAPHKHPMGSSLPRTRSLLGSTPRMGATDSSSHKQGESRPS